MATSIPTYDVANPLTPEVLAKLEGDRTVTRRRITTICREVESIIDANGSIGSLKVMLTKIRTLLSTHEQLSEILIAHSTSEDDTDKQFQAQLKYLRKVEDVADAIKAYRVSQNDVTSSTASSAASVKSSRSSQRGPLSETEKKLKELDEEKRRKKLEFEQANERAKQAKQELDRVEMELENLDVDEWKLRHPGSPVEDGAGGRTKVEDWFRTLSPSQPTESQAPDGWIEDYLADRVEVSTQRSTKFKSADLEFYGGDPIDWFCWIDLFKVLVHETPKSPGEKLTILKGHLTGECQMTVKTLGGGEPAYKEALKRLKQSFGRRDVLRVAHLQALERLERGNNATAFQRFADRVRAHLFDLSRIGETAQPDIIEKICRKLAQPDRLAWNDKKPYGASETRSLEEFADWLCQRAAAYQTPTRSSPNQAQNPERRIEPRVDRTKRRFRFRKKCKGQHRLTDCPAFQKLAVGERFTFVQTHRLCFNCLGANHSVRFCNQWKECGRNGCNRRHHPLLHHDDKPAAAKGASARCSKDELQEEVAMGVMNVRVQNSRGEYVWANLFIDEGSNTSLARSDFIRSLGIDGEDQKLEMKGIGGVSRCYNTSKEVILTVRLLTGGETTIKVSTMPTVTDPMPYVDWNKLKTRWKHLKSLPIKSAGGQVDLLIGVDHYHLIVPTESRVGEEGEPSAVKTQFGWYARGVIGSKLRRPPTSHTVTAVRSYSLRVNAALEKELRGFCETENFGTETPRLVMPPEDERAVKIVEEGTRKLEIGYEVPIPWKEGEPSLPDNKRLALYRLHDLFKRFDRDPDFKAAYQMAIKKYIDAGYVSEVEEEGDPITAQYFLAHHGVYKKSASERKLRIVFDSAAQFQGKCLNDAMLTGPTLQNMLPSVLIKFREAEVAFTADIEAMFSRIRLRPQDARYHRFLWREDGSSEIKTL
ncbi:uncharacterized protein LOC130701908 [Daphnia carinata]|uniref:uncharacterized protein LOC130701908 n=1 Tax=Daphnia carinata TaxID=120202 RepID=UPI00257FF53D|nr:uncharacterized protein LOC130701908 [Daphnia carinata]